MSATSLFLWRIHPVPLGPFPLALPLTLGRHASCGLVLPEDDVSRVHAAVEARDAGIAIVDQGSRNGVYVQGRRVGVGTVTRGSIIRIGQSVFWVSTETPFRVEAEAFVETEARAKGPVVLAGERGAGKRTLARAIHARAGRTGPFVPLAGPLEPVLLQSLRGGTVVCEARDDLASLGTEAARHDVRLIGVTESAPDPKVRSFVVPPLRNRLDELPAALAKGLGGADDRWNADFVEALACHPFSLNFAELEVMCRDLAKTPGRLGVEHVPQAVRAHVVEARSASADDMSRERLHDALTRHKGNVRRVGQELGVQRGQLYRVLASFGLNPDAYRGVASPSGPVSPPPTASRNGDERRTSP